MRLGRRISVVAAEPQTRYVARVRHDASRTRDAFDHRPKKSVLISLSCEPSPLLNLEPSGPVGALTERLLAPGQRAPGCAPHLGWAFIRRPSSAISAGFIRF